MALMLLQSLEEFIHDFRTLSRCPLLLFRCLLGVVDSLGPGLEASFHSWRLDRLDLFGWVSILGEWACAPEKFKHILHESVKKL